MSREGTDDLWEAMWTQRAIRRWEEKPVPDELLVRLVEAATRAPSGSNTQPWRFIVVRDEARRRAIGGFLRAKYEANSALRGYLERAGERADRTDRLMLRGARDLFTGLDRAPALVVPCLYRCTSPVTDMNSLLAGSSIYQAVQNLLLAARGLGLGSVMTTFQQLIEPELRELLHIPADARPVALIPVGYPAANFGPVNRRPVQDVLDWEEWQDRESR